MRLEELSPGSSIVGLELSSIATIVAIVPIAEGTVTVIYRTAEGTLKERLLGRGDEPNISIATQERPWSFDGDGEAFKLAVEAKRIDLAFLDGGDRGAAAQGRAPARPHHRGHAPGARRRRPAVRAGR